MVLSEFCKEHNLGKNFPTSEKNIDTLLDLAYIAHFDNQWKVLEIISSRIIEIDPKNEDGLFYKGLSIFNLDESSKQAMSYFEKVIDICGPRAWFAYWGKTLICLNNKEYENALDCCEALIKLEPINAHSWELKSEVLSKMDRKEEADQCFAKAEELREQYKIPHWRQFVKRE